MYRNLKKVLIVLLSAVLVGCGVAIAGCSGCNNNAESYDGLFSGESHNYELTSDYTLTEKDVKGTEGDDNVTLGYICSFNLGGHTLNLGGYTLNVTSSSKEVVKFENGKITNGSLNISVPNGDIEFKGTEIDETVTYELEAASETIRFSNAVISGKCTVKSNTHVSVEYSNVGDITLAGNGTLTAGSGASLGAVTVSEQASGAKVNISPSASVINMELKSAASVSVAGSVSSVKVAETAKNDSSSLSIKIEETASVDKVELNAAASVSVAGSVQAVIVAEAAKNDSAALSINVADTAEISRVELNAPAAVEVSGGVSNIVVAGTAGGSSVTLKETASVTTVAVNAGNTKIESNNASVSKVVVAESVKNSVTSNVEVITATDKEMEEYFAHQHILTVVSRVEATCTAAGEINYKCECGETSKKVIPALGHSYVYSVVKEPTETEKGQGLYKCSRCGDEYTVAIDNYVSVSMVIDGLHYLFSVIPDGVYTISADKNSPIKATQSNGSGFTLDLADAVIEVNSGNLSGTFNGVMTMKEGSYNDEMKFKAVVDNNNVFVYYYSLYEHSGSRDEDEGGMFVSLSSLINMGLAQILPVDVEEFKDVLSYLDKIQGGNGNTAALPTGLLVKAIEAVTTKTTENGNTVYTLDSEKLLNILTELGGKTVADLVDEAVGEGAFKAIEDLTDGVADKNVLSFALKLYAFTEKFGISQEDLFAIVQTILDEVKPDSEINFKDLITGYYDKTVAEAVAEVVGGEMTAAKVKELIEQYTEQYLGMCKQATVAQLVDMLIGSINGGSAEGEVAAVAEGAEGAESAEAASFYNTLLGMVGAYADNLTLSVTLNASNKLVAYEISYLDESGIKVNITKTADSLLPAIDVDVMGVKAELTETDNGATATVDVMGMLFTLTAETTNTGANLNFTMDMGEISADVDLAINVKAENKVYGAELELSGEVAVGSSQSDSIVLSGKVNIEKNDSAQLDKSVWDSFEGDKAMYRHIDVTMKAPYGNAVIRLKYVSEEAGEYYLLTKTVLGVSHDGVQETVYSTKLLSVDGLPEIMLTYENDCTGWIQLGISHSALAEVAQTVIINEVRGETKVLETQLTEYYGHCYYNVKTGEVSDKSAHSLKITGKYAEGSTKCEDGIIVTTTCEKCDYKQVRGQESHYYIDNKNYLNTQCGNEDYINERECVVCHVKSLEYEIYSSHHMSSAQKPILSEAEYEIQLDMFGQDVAGRYVNIADLAKDYAFEITGFYHGSLDLNHCAECGLNVYRYTYYTNTQTDGCVKHSAYVVEYNGNADYNAFELKGEVLSAGHYSVGAGYEEYDTVSAAIQEVTAIIGGNLPFTPEEAGYYESRCEGCNVLVSKQISLGSGYDDLRLGVYYTDGEVSSWNYDADVYGLQAATEEAAKYGQSFEGATEGSIHYQLSLKSSWTKVCLSSAEAEFTLEFHSYRNNSDSLTVNIYYVSECRNVQSSYVLKDGKWVLKYTDEYERHWIVNDYVYGENCIEDGYYYSNGCKVCGEGAGDIEILHYHKGYVYYVNSVDIYQYVEYITSDVKALSSISASISGRIYDGCCQTMGDVEIVLRSNWTLTGDVYIKAEGITINLNGFTIDLNGYNLVIYSYAGATLTLTDNTFDTSSIEGYDPETYEGGYKSKITDSQKAGTLIVVSCAEYNEKEIVNIVVGTIAIECNVFASDTDDRYSLYDSFAGWTEDGEKLGYELPLLKAERQ